ncbi:MAG: methionine synthase [Chloroflexota bacterium]
MTWNPTFQTTAVGSFPHRNGRFLSQKLASLLDVPAWPQLPRRDFRENMYVQYSAHLPGVKLDEANEKIWFETSGDLSEALEQFYTPYLSDDVDAFALPPAYTTGLAAMLDTLRTTPGDWAKGHVTGPISFGLTVTDQDLRAALYDEMLADPIVKNMAMNARWQVRQLQTVRPKTIIFVDEPYMAAFGSAFIALQREQVVAMLDEVFTAVQQEGALAGVHCCANTDWSVLLSTQVDILNLDAYGYLENLALYPAELRTFLDRGGIVAWGIVPNNELVHEVTAQELAQKLRAGLSLIEAKAKGRGVRILADELAERSLITTSCGMGSTTEDVADRALALLVETSSSLQRG